MSTIRQIDPERGWAGAVLAVLVALVVGAVLFPRVVWDGFLWQYLWEIGRAHV